MEKYEKIINNEYIGSLTHPKMSIYDRAAQFSPFAALTGFENSIAETGRLTDSKIELSETQKEELDRKLQLIKNNLSKNIICTFIYFVADDKKQGGKYIALDGIVKRIAQTENTVFLIDGNKIPIPDILEIKSELFP